MGRVYSKVPRNLLSEFELRRSELEGCLFLVPSQRTGAPYLARFSRDVGYHCSFPLTLDSSDSLSGQHRWNPTSREKRARCGAPVLCVGTESPKTYIRR